VKLTLEYDGTAFHGWARQLGLRTVEGVLREALDAVFLRWDGLAVAGRTDTGVHATGQVASFSAEGGPPPARVAEALNGTLPDDVVVLAAEEAPEGFHARFSARSRSYRYRVCAGASRPALDVHLEAGLHQLLHGLGHQRDPALPPRGLLRDADLHRGRV